MKSETKGRRGDLWKDREERPDEIQNPNYISELLPSLVHEMAANLQPAMMKKEEGVRTELISKAPDSVDSNVTYRVPY